MHEIDWPPNAPVLMEAMRSVGYSLESALADLIDNSLSAHARSIRIQFRPIDNPYVALIDDGDGMLPDELDVAMRHGSRSPQDTRALDDLGRFGLGLKTASLSQSRRFTVASLKKGILSARCWDLDVVARRGGWTMLALDGSEARRVPHVEDLLAYKNGTVVLWEKLDRLLAGESDPVRALGQKMDEAREHLATVFHRYISGDHRHARVHFSINDNPLEAFDPFMEGHRATQPLDEERFRIENRTVVVRPFILPHLSKLSAEEVQRAGGSEGLRSKQGFYVYRNRRLIVWGTWFKLARKQELSKLARVRVDIPNSLDHLWTLDIKKAIASPPEAVRVNLRRTIERITDRSRRTYRFRGRAASAKEISHGWNRVENRDGIRYEINRNHPAVQALRSSATSEMVHQIETVLHVLEASLPIDALYADLADDRKSVSLFDGTEEPLRQMASSIASQLGRDTVAGRAFLSTLHLIEPFARQPELARRIALEIEHAV